MTRAARFPLILLFASLVVVVDRLSKGWFLNNFQWGESRPVTPFLYWTLIPNTGSAFGFLQNSNRLLLYIAYAVLAIVLYAARGLCERGGRWACAGVALILGGAVGNIIDRHLYGHVVDFIDFRVWPVFNVADSAITVGAVLTAWGLFLGERRQRS